MLWGFLVFIFRTICAWIGVGLGVSLGVLAGLTIGSYIFASFEPKRFDHLMESADHGDLPPGPAEHKVPAELRNLLRYTSSWLSWPDYYRTEMVNRIFRNLWPHLDKAIMAEVFVQAKPHLEDTKKKMAFIEDIILDQENFSLGDVPFRLGGLKTYHTGENELILEVPIVWGSTCKFHVKVLLRLGPIRLFIPIEVSGIQFKADTRITIKPLVEKLPCIGGATITLLGVPHVDLSLKLFKGIDLMALPGIQDGLRFGIKHVLDDMLVYPNSMSFPLMDKPGPFGIMPPPKGTLSIVVSKVEGLAGGSLLNKLDPYVMLEIRKGRPVKTDTGVYKSECAQYDQQFYLVVDLPEIQNLKIRVWDDDYGWEDSMLAYGELNLATKSIVDEKEKWTEIDFLKTPNVDHKHVVQLFKPTKLQKAEAKNGKLNKTKREKLMKLDGDAPPKAAGNITLRITFIPFLNPSSNADLYDSDEEEGKGKRPPPPVVYKRAFAGRVGDLQKGVLTCSLIRARALQSGTAKNADSYVKLTLADPDPSKHVDIKFTSDVIYNDSAPRWDQKFDFVMISASSVLYLSVYDKPSGILNTVNPLKLLTKADDKLIGRVSVLVKEVADNGRLKDVWTLSDAKTGTMELLLEWHSCHVADG